MRYVLFLWLFLLSGLAFAGNISEQEARRVAAAFLQTSPQTRVGASSLQLVFDSESILTRSDGSAPAYYVFDNTAGSGFVIVAGDDLVRPVLGYSFSEEFPQGTLPPNLRDWLDNVRREVNDLRRSGATAEETVTRAWTDTRAGNVVVELQTADWNQEAPYNQLCPVINGQKTYTGCTATALAIAMRYHQWPASGKGVLPAYTSASTQTAIPSQRLGHAYDWANMPLTYGTGYSDTEAKAVATLMRDCALMLQSDFGVIGSDGTAAYAGNIPTGLITFMGYDKAMRYVERGYYTMDEWIALMKGELDNDRPVIYTGYNSNAGHAFVLDGYTTDNYFSVNWGWSGRFNGYFLLTAMEPDGQGAGGSGSYNDGQGAVIGMQRDAGGVAEDIVLFVSYEDANGTKYNGLTLDGTIAQNEPFTVRAGLITNRGVMNITPTVKLAVTDRNGQEVETLGNPVVSPELQPAYGFSFEQQCVITQPIRSGYRIRAFYRTDQMADWALIRGNEETDTAWEIILAEESIEESTSFTYNRYERVIRLQVDTDVSVTLTGADGTDRSSLCSRSGQTVSIDTSQLETGTHTIVLKKGNVEKRLQFTTGAANR